MVRNLCLFCNEKLSDYFKFLFDSWAECQSRDCFGFARILGVGLIFPWNKKTLDLLYDYSWVLDFDCFAVRFDRDASFGLFI